ncbi:hypothetical protein ENINCK372B1_23960 [Enterobacter intestinihominis]
MCLNLVDFITFWTKSSFITFFPIKTIIESVRVFIFKLLFKFLVLLFSIEQKHLSSDHFHFSASKLRHEICKLKFESCPIKLPAIISEFLCNPYSFINDPNSGGCAS